MKSFVVIPAKAGIQGWKARRLPWTPAFAGVTSENECAKAIKATALPMRRPAPLAQGRPSPVDRYGL
jgi:hypothetical protein